MIHVVLPDAVATEALGAALAEFLSTRRAGSVWLRGNLGAGKTTLVRGLLRTLGVTGPVRSPTYTLVEPYDCAAGRVLHMDLYRLADPEEIWALGLDSEPPQTTIWLVEWPEVAARVLPEPDIEIEINTLNGSRAASLRLAAGTDAAQVAGLQQAISRYLPAPAKIKL